MKIVQSVKTVRVPAEKGAATLIFRSGRRYLLHDDEAASGLSAKALEGVEALPGQPELFDPQRHEQARVVFPFIGGYGDAVSCVPVLHALARQFPRVRLTVATTPGPREILELGGVPAAYVQYPLTERDFAGFDAYLSLEAVGALGPVGDGGLPDHFARALRVPFDPQRDTRFPFVVPPQPGVTVPDDGHPRVGLAVSAGVAARDWPIQQQALCARELILQGARLYLLGSLGGQANWPAEPPVVNNLVGQTPSLALLAAWVSRMDMVVSTDSFLMHLAGALGVPAVAVFGPTSHRHAAPYPNVTPVIGTAPCAPCGWARPGCPMGNVFCPAMRSTPVRGQHVATQALALLGSLAHS